MFKVSADPKFTHPVRVMVPTDGGHEEQTFKATFRVIDVEELTSIEEQGGQKAVLRAVVTHMAELADDHGNEVPYSDGLRDQLIGNPSVRIALYQTYRRAITKAPEGN